MRRVLRLLAAPAGCLLAAACTSLPPAPPAAPPAVAAAPTAVVAFEERTREHAEAGVREGRLAQAADDWEILTVLRPENADYRERLEALRARIELEANAHLQRAQQASRRGDVEAATAQYAAVLALQPQQRQAADALRAIERERNRRTVLGKPAAANAGRRGGVDTPATAGTPSP
jgi:type II secretory pathway component HofQ